MAVLERSLGGVGVLPLNPLRRYRPFLEVARRVGVDVVRCLERIGLSETEALYPETRVPRDRVVLLCADLFQLADDAQFGLHAAECTQPADTDLLSLARYSQDLTKAADLMTRYGRLGGDAVEFGVERTKGCTSITLKLSGGRMILPETADWALATWFLYVRAFTDGRAIPMAVHFAHPRPSRVDRHRRFFGAPVEFDMDRCALVYAESDARIPFVDRDPRLLSLLQRQAEDSLVERSPPSRFAEKIRAMLARELSEGEPTMARVSRRMGMSERTLRRRLLDAECSYRALLEDVRKEQALAFIRRGESSVTAIAHRVGFSDATAFSRAFRRWTGTSPRRFTAQVG